jgi:hypothetical protein
MKRILITVPVKGVIKVLIRHSLSYLSLFRTLSFVALSFLLPLPLSISSSSPPNSLSPTYTPCLYRPCPATGQWGVGGKWGGGEGGNEEHLIHNAHHPTPPHNSS